MREIRTSGSEGGGTGNLTGPPYPYGTAPGEPGFKPHSWGAVPSPAIHRWVAAQDEKSPGGTKESGAFTNRLNGGRDLG